MTVYNVNLGIGWASSGVEYAQSYRAQLLRSLNIPAKFIFSDLIMGNNIQDLTSNLGFTDDQVIWFYNFFTDVKIAPSDYSYQQWQEDEHIADRSFVAQMADDHKSVQLASDQEGLVIVVRFHDTKEDHETIDQVSYISNGILIKRDFYSYVKYATEYYTGTAQNNHPMMHDFYNEDGSVAYTDHEDGKTETFEFPGHIYYSKNELYAEMIKRLHFTKDDTLIIDRMDDGGILINGQLLFEMHQPAKLVIVVHADHFDKHYTNQQHILWNNFYEYQFTHTDDVAAFVVSTDVQKQVLFHQFNKYEHKKPEVVTIPVGSLPQLIHPQDKRRPHSLITASRLAGEKHIDWLVLATVQAREQVPDVQLDIYGEGPERGRLEQLIKENHAEDYIHLMGQHDLTNVYCHYAGYIAASTSEGFGLSLMEAVGSGLPMIGFDVPYGNPTFISDGKNGHLLPYEETWQTSQKVDTLAKAIIQLFTKDDWQATSKNSYKIAEEYLSKNVAQRWQKMLEELHND